MLQSLTAHEIEALYGGAAARDSVPVSGGGSYLAGSRGLGDFTISEETTSRFALHLFAIGGVLVGGALTGYLASGQRGSGAVIGAATHLALFGATVALFGSQFSTGERFLYGSLALGTSVGVGYLLFARSRRR